MLPLSELLISHYNFGLFCGIAALPLTFNALNTDFFFVVLGAADWAALSVVVWQQRNIH